MIRTKRALAAHLRLGAAGERAAAVMLENCGCTVLARDLRLPQGELDIVCRDGCTLVFVEVKSRFLKKGAPEEEIRPADQLRQDQKRRIMRAALAYISRLGCGSSLPFRFDLVEAVFNRYGLYMLRHHKSAFGFGRQSNRRGGLLHGNDGEIPLYF